MLLGGQWTCMSTPPKNRDGGQPTSSQIANINMYPNWDDPWWWGSARSTSPLRYPCCLYAPADRSTVFCTTTPRCDKLPGKGVGRKVRNAMTSSLTISLGLPCTLASEPSHPSVLLLLFRGSLETSSPFLGKQNVTSHSSREAKALLPLWGSLILPCQGSLPHQKGPNFGIQLHYRSRVLPYLPPLQPHPPREVGTPGRGTALLKPARDAKESGLKRIKIAIETNQLLSVSSSSLYYLQSPFFYLPPMYWRSASPSLCHPLLWQSPQWDFFPVTESKALDSRSSHIEFSPGCTVIYARNTLI